MICAAVVLAAAGAAVVHAEVAAKRGMTGMALRAGLSAIERLRSDVVSVALDALLPSFAEALRPMVASAEASGDVAAWFASHDGEVADALLAVTDARAERAASPMLQRTYAGLRGVARGHTAAAAPALGRLVAQFVAG